MDNSFFAYTQLMELMAFFSGYPLLYAIVYLIFGKQELGQSSFKSRIVFLLPYAYALVGTLYLGLQLKNLYPDYSFENIGLSIHRPYLIAWGLLSMLFWIPALSKKIVFSLMHSFVFFYFLLRDLFLQIVDATVDKDIVRNDMKIYTVSLFVNLGAFLFIILSSFIISLIQNRSKTHSAE